MAGLRDRNKQMRVEQILNAASELFASQGYEASRIEEIAHCAGVSPATVYNYFSTKANILTALAVQHARRSLPARRAFVRNPPEDPLAAVQVFEKLLADQALKTLGRECWRVIFAAPYTQPGSPLHRAGIRFNKLILRHYIQMLQEFQRRGAITPDADVAVLADLFTALGTHHFGGFISSDTMTLEEMKSAIERHVTLAFSGIRMKPDTKQKRARVQHILAHPPQDDAKKASVPSKPARRRRSVPG
jgi:AcrR family transcriptional regulator